MGIQIYRIIIQQRLSETKTNGSLDGFFRTLDA